MFKGCSNIESLDLSNWTQYSNKLTNLYCTFSTCNKLTNIYGIENWDVSNVKDFTSTFSGCNNLSVDLSNWDTSGAETMKYTFRGVNLSNINGYENLDTSNVTDIEGMFSACKDEYIDISNYKLDKVTSVKSLFEDCTNLSTISSSEDIFDAGMISKMSRMFYGCKSLPTVFPYIINVASISDRYSISNMFLSSSVREVTLSNASPSLKQVLEANPQYIGHNSYKADGFIIKFINDAFDLYYYAKNKITGYKKATEIPQSNLEELTNIIPCPNASYAFNEMYKVTSIPITNTWNTSYVKDMSYMFQWCEQLQSLDLSGWDTSKVTNMKYMLAYCRNLSDIDLSLLNTSKVTDMGYMMYECRKIDASKISNWDVSNVTNMRLAFSRCYATKSMDLSKWNTSKVTDMNNMFCSCTSLTSLNVANFDVSNVTDMYYMFGSCSKLTGLDLSRWNTSKVTNMGGMFAECKLLNNSNLNISGLDTSKASNMYKMFYQCSGLTGILPITIDCSSITAAGNNIYNTSGMKDMLYGTGITKIELKNVREDLKSQITAEYLGKNSTTLEVVFVN
jgi:surface protein